MTWSPARIRNLRIAASGQPHLLAGGVVGQRLGGRAEGIGAEGEDRVLGALVLVQLRTDAGQQHAELERLGDVVVGAGIEAEDGVGLGIGAGQHQDRHPHAAAPQQPAHLAPVHVGQADVENDEVEMARLARVQRLGAGRRGVGFELPVQVKLFAQRGAQRLVVLDQTATGQAPMTS